MKWVFISSHQIQLQAADFGEVCNSNSDCPGGVVASEYLGTSSRSYNSAPVLCSRPFCLGGRFGTYAGGSDSGCRNVYFFEPGVGRQEYNQGGSSVKICTVRIAHHGLDMWPTLDIRAYRPEAPYSAVRPFFPQGRGVAEWSPCPIPIALGTGIISLPYDASRTITYNGVQYICGGENFPGTWVPVSGVITTPQVNAQCAPLATRRQALVVKVASYEAMRTRVQGRVDYYNQLLLGQVNERQAMERTRDGYVRQVASIDAAINSMRGRVQGIDTQRQSLSCP